MAAAVATGADPVRVGSSSSPGVSRDPFGNLGGRYLMIEDMLLFDVLDGSRAGAVGIGTPNAVVPVLCVRGPYPG